jgi:hypothetical protein
MKHTFILLLIYFPLNALAGEQIFISGIPTINSSGNITINECSTGNDYKIGTIASGPYFKLSNKIDDLAKSGGVLVTVKGEVGKRNHFYINYPEVINVKQGKCNEPST